MAVTFKSDAGYGYNLASLFGVSPSLLVLAKKNGVLIEQTYPGSFTIMYKGTCFGSVVIKGQAISLVKAGTLGPSSKMAVAMQLEQALNKALNKAVGSASLQFAEDAKSFVEDASISTSPVSNSNTLLKAKPLSELIKEKSAAQLKGHLAKLEAETSSPSTPMTFLSLKQKIAGTSSGSSYTVFALFKGDMALALRVKNGILSVRVVFSSPKAAGTYAYKEDLVELGFTLKAVSSGPYCSAHYSCGKKELMVKTLGSVLATLGMDLLIEVSDLKEAVTWN